MSAVIECDSVDDVISIIKKLIVDGNGDPYTDCGNSPDSVESLIRQTLYVDDSNNVYINFVE